MLCSFGYSFLCLGMSIWQIATCEAPARMGPPAASTLRLVLTGDGHGLPSPAPPLAELPALGRAEQLRARRQPHRSAAPPVLPRQACPPPPFPPRRPLRPADGAAPTRVDGYPVSEIGSAQLTWDVFNGEFPARSAPAVSARRGPVA